ncbi:MAG: nucleotidyltransferase family protein [Thermoanaerobaculia bacterium]
MNPSRYRFHPPAVEVSPEMRWALLRAFGPADAPFADVPEARCLIRAASALDLSARIGSRSDSDRLSAEMGSAAEEFVGASRRCADEAVLNSLAAQDVAAAARDLSIPLVFLKFQALVSGGYVAGNARGTSDVDVLVPRADAERFRRALLDVGFRPSGCPGYEHQTSPVVHPFGVSVDIHRKLLGVRLEGRRSADARDLIERGLCDPLPGAAGEPAVPAREVLIAHALVHGVAQNGLAPHAYPLTRMIADLIDLDLPGAGSGSPGWADWISRDVSAAELAAVSDLCESLRSGETAKSAGRSEHFFLGHIVAAVVAPGYSRSLALRGLFHEPTDRWRPRKLSSSLFGALFPPLSALARAPVSGRSDGPWRAVWRRFARPWVLLGRALR